MMGAITDEKMTRIVDAMLEKAETDPRAARLFFDIVQAEPVSIQQAVQVNHHAGTAHVDYLSDMRENLARVIAQDGPQQAPALAGKIHATLEKVYVALNDHPWFEKARDGWHITDLARAEALLPAPEPPKRKRA